MGFFAACIRRFLLGIGEIVHMLTVDEEELERLGEQYGL